MSSTGAQPRSIFTAMIAWALVLSVVSAAGTAPEGHLATWSVGRIDLAASDVLFDPVSGTLLASTRSSSLRFPNSVVAIDPSTGAVGRHVFVGSEPGPLAASDDGSTLYVGLRGAAKVVRLELADFAVVERIDLGLDENDGPLFPVDVEVQPGNPDVFAVSLENVGEDDDAEGVAIFRRGKRRSRTGRDAPTIAFGAAPDRLYGFDNRDDGFNFRRFSVRRERIRQRDSTENLVTGQGQQMEFSNGLLYVTSGLVVDPEALTQEGRYDIGTFRAPVAVAPSLDRTFFARKHEMIGPLLIRHPDTATILEFVGSTFAPVAELVVEGIAGEPTSLTAIGSTGLAFATSEGELFLIGPAQEPS